MTGTDTDVIVIGAGPARQVAGPGRCSAGVGSGSTTQVRRSVFAALLAGRGRGRLGVQPRWPATARSMT